MDLYNWKFRALKSFPSVVFMNACHSGRLCRNDRANIFDDGYRTGFATFFLERGAKGVVGTLGKVDDTYAAQIARNFFAEYKRNSNLTVAELLRNLRAEADRNLQIEDSTENYLLFLYTFMYIYYGHPLTVLQLTPAEV